MPEISRFLGIHIRMYYRDVDPPHIHAEYGDYEVTLELESGIVDGRFPRRAMIALLEWYGMHEQELLSVARTAGEEYQLERIEPLE